jgi:hypothetical protein
MEVWFVTMRERQRQVQLYRGQMPSPGRPTVAWREDRVRFWAAIRRGASSEDAGCEAGVSPAVGTRWFRQAGGVASKLPPAVDAELGIEPGPALRQVHEQVLAADPLLDLPTPAGAAATRTLPRDIASFTGRERELAQLLDSIDGQAASGAVVGIHAIDGMAGIGKTTFAVHAARTGSPRASPMGSISCRCTAIHPASGRWTRPMRWPACC